MPLTPGYVLISFNLLLLLLILVMLGLMHARQTLLPLSSGPLVFFLVENGVGCLDSKLCISANSS